MAKTREPRFRARLFCRASPLEYTPPSREPTSRGKPPMTLHKPLLPLLCLGLACLPAPVRAADEPARLHDLFHREWELRLQEDPLFATSVGRHEYDDRLPSVTPENLARRAAVD